MSWINFFNLSLDARGTDDFIPAETLRSVVAAHDGKEAYHSAFDLDDTYLKCEENTGEVKDGKTVYRYHAQTPETLKRFPKTVTQYAGPVRPALGYVWFDFDSADGGVAALSDARNFFEFIGKPEGLTFYYSGSKGFHMGIPFAYFGLPVSPTVGKDLHALAVLYKKQFPTIDTTVFNAQRKFRALGSKHPKTKLYKIALEVGAFRNFSLPDIRKLAAKRGLLAVPEAPLLVKPLQIFTEALKARLAAAPAGGGESIGLNEWRRYRQPEGTEIFAQCGFVAWGRDNAATVNEPQWYALASIVGRMKDGRAKFQALSKGHPGYSSTATDEKLEQAMQASGPRKCSAIEDLWPGCKNCKHYQRIVSPIVILDKNMIATEATGYYDLLRDGEKIKRIPNYNDLLLAFVRDTPYKTIADMKTVYAFTGTHYEEKTPIEIKGFAEQNFEPKPAEKLRQEFSHKVFANHIAKRTFFTSTTEDKLNFKNGVLDLCAQVDANGSHVLRQHNYKFGFRHCLPYEFNSSATAPVFLNWINDVMLGDAELVAILQEYMGYVIRGGEYKYHKALWLSGSGRNGKSTFLTVLKALIGAGNYSTLSIRQIINDKFSSADLDGKIANFSEETSPEELSDSGPFKNLTGDGELLAQKKYGDPYSFRSRAKLIMTYNEVPQLKDLSPGMLSRPLIIPWKKDLTNEGSQDKGLHKKLLAELSGIFNFAFEGWLRLEQNEQFSTSQKSVVEMEDIQEASCTAIRWFKEHIELTDISQAQPLRGRQLYEAYKLNVGQYAYSEVKFGKRISTLRGIPERKSHSKNGVEYNGMRLRRGSSQSIDF